MSAPAPVVAHIELWYPRVKDPNRPADHPQAAAISLMDVRSADTIHVEYDFERDGWRITMDSIHAWPADIGEITDTDTKPLEVAFIPARITNKDCPCDICREDVADGDVGPAHIVDAETEACARVVDERASQWRGHGGAAIGHPWDHLTVEGELDTIAVAIRRRHALRASR